MCREALKHYLAKYEGAEASSRFVDEGDAEGLQNPESVLDALRRVRVCDPACGSGAYLLGIMQELVRLRGALFVSRSIGDDSAYKIKRSIIESNLYGVDKDPFAVQIAALRLWLSLAIDSAKPQPLPLHQEGPVTLTRPGRRWCGQGPGGESARGDAQSTREEEAPLMRDGS